VKSKHWTRWLGTENRCVVPFNSFSEFNKTEGGDIWFALDESRPLACFAGIWTNWMSDLSPLCAPKQTSADFYGFMNPACHIAPRRQPHFHLSGVDKIKPEMIVLAALR
jgi:putative SOS response-associated peptidase YedK